MKSLFCNILKNESESNISILFNYEHLSNKRLFTFRRTKDEQLAVMAKRMKINFEKVFKQLKQDCPLAINFYYNNQVLDNLDIRNEDFWVEGSVMHINEKIYPVHVNLPTILDLKIPNTILAGYLIYPNIDLINGNISTSTFTWFISNKSNDKAVPLDNDWKQIGTQFTYEVKEDDVECKLKLLCEPSDGQCFGLLKEVISSKSIVNGPLNCPFESRIPATLLSLNQFRVVSYNLLADIYAHSEYSQNSLFSYCKPKYLSFDYRKLLILKELMHYNGDLYFLQEVDRSFYYKGLSPIFSKLQYRSNFLCKEQMVEGLAIFYKETKFDCLESTTKTFSDLLLNCSLFGHLKDKIMQNENLLNRISKLKNGFQTLLLRSKQNENKLLIVCNLHLYSKDDADHVRLFQSFICFRYIQHLIEQLKTNHKYSDCEISPIISGDYNSTPEFGVVTLVKNKIVDSSLEDFRSNQEEIISDIVLEHQLDLESACAFPCYTNYTENFVGCLDYIFYDCAKLKVVEVVAMPSHDQVTQQVAIPSQYFPSDHIAIVCSLAWS